MIKITGVAFYKVREGVDLGSGIEFRCSEVVEYTSNMFCKDIVCKD